MVEPRYSLAPQVITVSFGVEPAYNALESLSLLPQVNDLSGLGDWVLTTSATLPPDRRRFHEMLFDALGYLFIEVAPPMPQHRDFLAYVQSLGSMDAEQVVSGLFEAVQHTPHHHAEGADSPHELPSVQTLRSERAAFVQFMMKWKDCSDTALLEDAHRLLSDPAALLAAVTAHLRWMWDETLAEEWERVKPMVEESVAAYERLSFHNLTPLEAVRAVTGRDMTGKMGSKLEMTEHILFVPNAHIGPYISKWLLPKNRLLVAFGARLPRGVQTQSSALGRSELLVRLNALADDTRLRILELLTQHDELCAQDIIERLGLSQSTISRHLSQLSASGYITERRREVAKCYALNTDRVVDTVRSLTNFLSRQ